MMLFFELIYRYSINWCILPNKMVGVKWKTLIIFSAILFSISFNFNFFVFWKVSIFAVDSWMNMSLSFGVCSLETDLKGNQVWILNSPAAVNSEWMAKHQEMPLSIMDGKVVWSGSESEDLPDDNVSMAFEERAGTWMKDCLSFIFPSSFCQLS